MLGMLRKVPWKIVKSTIDWVRRRRAVDWPDVPVIELESTHAELAARLRDDHYEGTPYTLKYRGEVLNLRRPTGMRTSEDDGFDYYSEDHVRTRDHPDDDELIQVCVHNEWSRYEEKTGHVHERDIEWLDEGQMRALLASSGIDVPRVEAR